MSIAYICDSCDYEGRVSPAKAGSLIECPSCGSEIEVEETSAPTIQKTRPSSADGNVNAIVGIGAGILVVGLLILFGLKSLQSDPVPEDIAATGTTNTGSATTENIDQSAETPRTDPATETPSPVEGEGVEPEFSLPAMAAIDPSQILLARLSNVVLVVERFEKDDRGAVSQAVTAATEQALQRCKLTTTSSGTDPKLTVELSLDTSTGIQKLKLNATLEGDMQGLPVKFWERANPVMLLDDQALKSGVIPPGLDREVGQFFTSLREKIVAARRVVNARLKTKEFEDEP